jgi:hypothetical protein
MPRKARIDAPGALHHIIVRGIEKRKIFKDNTDRQRLIERLKTTDRLCRLFQPPSPPLGASVSKPL